jgi:hypothetical protein
MNILKLAVAAVAFSAGVAHADVQAPVYECALTFKAKGAGIQVIIGSFELKGHGRINCVDAAGNTESLPVNVRLGTRNVAPTIGAGILKVAGVASGVGFTTGPEGLLGTYVALGGRGAFVIGAGAQIALHGTDNAATLNGTLQAVGGLGFQLGVDFVEVTPR